MSEDEATSPWYLQPLDECLCSRGALETSIFLGHGFTSCLCIQRRVWLDSGCMFLRQFMVAAELHFFYMVMDPGS